jgi:hypothetical protein
MGRTACAELQCLYKGALYLTVELYLYSPMGRTACAELQCLYKGALHFFYQTAFNYSCCIVVRGPGSVAGIATGYRLDGPGIESATASSIHTWNKVHIDRRYSLHLQISTALVESHVFITKTKEGSIMSCQHYEICKVAILTAQSLYPKLPIC